MSKKKVLLLGGTGAMGKHLQVLLAENMDITVTGRKNRESDNSVTFVKRYRLFKKALFSEMGCNS